jgi:antitoxin FitA
MPQRLLEVDPEVICRLNERAAAHGVSAEDEHREVLRHVLVEDADDVNFPDLKALLLQMPEVGEDADFERIREYPRDIDWS